MVRRIALPLLAALAALMLPTAVFAAWPALDEVPAIDATGQKDAAVIVAVEDYLLLPDVPGAIANANEWEVFLRSGLKVPNVYVLANQDATREGMLKFAATAAKDVGKGGTIWWIFIGHGAPTVDGKDGLLVGMDAQQSVESLGARGLPQNELLAALQAPGARTVMIVDACFSGRSANGEALAAGVQPVVAVQPSKLASDSVVLSAAKATEVAGQLEGARRPAFSYLMLGALRGWADDGDGDVTAGEALHFAQRKLRGVKGRQQTPQASGELQLVLARGVSENKPPKVKEVREDCRDGEVKNENGECVPAPRTAAPDASAGTEAERTLEYLQRRVVFDANVARQAGRILEGPAFYHAIGRPDLADKWRSHNPYMWVPGIAATAAGLFLFVYGIATATSDTASEAAQTGWFIGGSLGGFFTMAGGISLITFGFIGDYHPLSLGERKSAAEGFNKQLREERGLGPEVDWQNEPVKKRGFFGGVGASSPALGFTIRF